MNLSIMYFYYVESIREPDIKNFIEEHDKYKKYYEEKNSEKLSEPKDIDDILDIYNKRKKEYMKGGFFTDIYYLIVDFDNMLATEALIEKTENDKNFRGWINKSDEMYDFIHGVFVGTGKLEEALIRAIKNSKV